jgi:hypothetical protein
MNHTALAGAGVRVTGIHYKRTNESGAVCRNVLARNDDWRRAETILGEDRCDSRTGVKPHDQQILAIGFAYAGFGNTESYAEHRMQRTRIGSA